MAQARFTRSRTYKYVRSRHHTAWNLICCLEDQYCKRLYRHSDVSNLLHRNNRILLVSILHVVTCISWQRVVFVLNEFLQMWWAFLISSFARKNLYLTVVNINDPYSMQILFFELYFLFIEKLGNYLYILITCMHMFYDNATAAHNN